MVDGNVNVIAVAGGFLVRTYTGRVVVASDLGAVWSAVPDRGGAHRLPPLRGGHRGPGTIPAARAPLSRVALVTETPKPTVNGDLRIDARGRAPEDLVGELLAVTSAPRPPRILVQVRSGDLDRLLPQLRAHPSRPFGVRALHDPTDARPCRPLPLPLSGARSYRNRLPALLAWIAAVEGKGGPERLSLRLPLGDQHVLELIILRGIVTWCGSIRDRHDPVPSARISSADPRIQQTITALLG